MKFEWNEAKRKENLRKHGIDFVDITEMFDNPMFSYLDTRNDYGEERIIGIGYVQNRVLLVCVTLNFVQVMSLESYQPERH